MQIENPTPSLVASFTSENSSFSRDLPGLQIAVDSTSLGIFKECPRKYYYSLIIGLEPKKRSVHLDFGTWLHKARETYEHAKAEGSDHESALEMALLGVLRASWNSKMGRPWVSDHPTKNRKTLVQTVVWYLDEVAKNDPLKTVLLANGLPAVELSFTFPLDTKSLTTGEEIVLCGHLDRIVDFNDDLFVSDIKTTGSELSPSFFGQYSPDNQFSLYTAAGKVAFGTPVKGVIVDAIQVQVTGSRFARGIVQRSESQISEWLLATRYWVEQMEAAASQLLWPQNDKSCGLYGGCPFRLLCGKPPASREVWVKTEFQSRKWDPLERRGPQALSDNI